MNRLKGDMSSPRCSLTLFAALHFLALCYAGPVGPLPNVTSADVGLKEGSCSLGDVVYMLGDEFPGSDPCEKCKCSDGGMHCEKQQCELRPSCKAVHRPDHCCPTYQCDCEQEGRIYGNGEKLVDPVDPCRVCYCQGGEVVCRRIACFVRDDCTPRLVPGRCCPEYDNCPVRGVTALPGVSSFPPNLLPIEDIKSSVPSSVPRDKPIPEVTIKEITPVSEIPIITDVKIKEILPSQSIEVAEYASSKSPLIPREATSEKTTVESEPTKTEAPTIVEVYSSPSTDTFSKIESAEKNQEDTPPSKISFSTQDSINSEIYPSNDVNLSSVVSSTAVPESSVATTTKAPIIEEEDPSVFEHNPAFPPLPDDLAVLSNHGDEIVPEPSADNDHMISHEVSSTHSVEPKIEQAITTTPKEVSEIFLTTEKILSIPTDIDPSNVDTTTFSPLKENPMLNLRSAIPTEILNAPSYVPENTKEDLNKKITTEEPSTSTRFVTESPILVSERITEKTELPTVESFATTIAPESEVITEKVATTPENKHSTTDLEQTTSSLAKSNIATEVTSQTEFSSLPIETSDQNPHESDANAKDKVVESTVDPLASTTTGRPSSEIITVAKATTNENNVFENVETTEFILTSFGSSETVTDSVELIKISGDPEQRNAPIIAPPIDKKNSVLTDLINLVSDVATINDHTENPGPAAGTGSTSISDSEELIPVNAGYKSKNNNFNQNSITEVPLKAKNTPGNRQKLLEIEGEDSENITDHPAPNDKVEPTTRRPIIDNVSDNMPENKTEKKDIEIITQSYVPTINKRPTKVVMKKDNEKPVTETPEDIQITTSSEVVTDGSVVDQEAKVSTEETKHTDDPAYTTQSGPQ